MANVDPYDRERIARSAADPHVREICAAMMDVLRDHRYSYNFSWLGRPIIQLPQDLMALQEIVWRCRPDLIVETGIAHGGSLVFYASLLTLLGGDRAVIGIDIDVRPHNRSAIETHPLASRIAMLEGSSTDPAVVGQVFARARGKKSVMVVLDSNHTHEHVLSELRLYSPLVKRGSYLVVLDTAIEDMPEGSFAGRAWGPGNSPKSAVHAFLRENRRFEVDREMHEKLLLTTAPDGYLRCVED